MSKNCYHWGLSESGTCPDCGTEVTVGLRHRAAVRPGYTTDYAPLPWSQSEPSVREALAQALGVAATSVVIIDVRAANDAPSWERASDVLFSFAGSKVEALARVKMTEETVRDPERVEYEPVETA